MPTADWVAALPAAALATVAVVEACIRLPFAATIERLNASALRALDIVRSPASDHFKEKVLPRYAGRLLGASLSLGGWLLLCAAVYGGLFLTVAWPMLGSREAALSAIVDGRVNLAVLVIGIAWATLRLRRRDQRADYSASDQMLHRLALGSRGMKDLCDSVDQALVGRRAAPLLDAQGDAKLAPVYVTALARAGTTVVLEALYASGAFSTLTYRAMPFVTAPWLWGLFRRGRRQGELRERAHGDRLRVGVDSPEAFEECYWTTFAASDPVRADHLAADLEVPDPVLERYRRFVARIQYRDARGGSARRYLAKNNNNVLRIDALRRAFPGAHIVVPFRRPADHVASLLRQHRRFIERHREDPFTLEYMDFLGHHEFGAHFRPFAVAAGLRTPDPEALLDAAWWVDYWRAVYRWLVERHGDAVLWLDYDALCDAPDRVLGALADSLGLPVAALTVYAERIAAPSHDRDPAIDAAVDEASHALHTDLRGRAEAVGLG